MKNLQKLLSGGDLRSIGNSNNIVKTIGNQSEFDELFQYLFSKDRLVKMRAADAIEKISVKHPVYLNDHKNELIELLNIASDIELKWHIAQLISRITLTVAEITIVWKILSEWAMDKNQSRIVRVDSLQSLFDLSKRYPCYQNKFFVLLNKLEKEQIPSLTARIRKLRKLQERI